MNKKVVIGIASALAVTAIVATVVVVKQTKDKGTVQDSSSTETVAEATPITADELGIYDEDDPTSDAEEFKEFVFDIQGESLSILKITGSGSVVVPSNVGKYEVLSIQRGALVDCPATKLSIPDGVSIGSTQCNANTKLEELSIGSNCYVDNYAFQDSTNLKSVSIGSGTAWLGLGVFKDCSALENVSLGNGFETIPDEMFSGCTSLKSVSIPNSVLEIADNAFEDSGVTELVGSKNSIAKEYAAKHGMNFKEIEYATGE